MFVKKRILIFSVFKLILFIIVINCLCKNFKNKYSTGAISRFKERLFHGQQIRSLLRSLDYFSPNL